MSVFSKIISSGVQAIANKTAEGAQKFTRAATKNISEEVQEASRDYVTGLLDPSRDYGSLWEKNENVEFCRNCNFRFQGLLSLSQKHHCRSCASVFCDSCCPPVPLVGFYLQLMPRTMNTATLINVRLCEGCKLGECPSQAMKEYFRKQLDASQNVKDDQRLVIFDKSLDKIHQKVLGKLNETLGLFTDEVRPLKTLKLTHGSYYGEVGLPRKNSARALPNSGYFELHNKSKEVMCVKVVYSGAKLVVELPRPSYIAIPPNDSVYSFFNPESETIDVIVLHHNMYPVPEDTAISYDTRAHGANPERISKCAQVREFSKGTIYHISCYGHNVLLKYKGKGLVMPRLGNGLGRVGFFGVMQGRRYASGLIDYSTNITSTHQCYTFNVSPLVPAAKRSSASPAADGGHLNDSAFDRIMAAPLDT